MAVNRITGIASGMDVDSLVAKLMSAERIPLDKIKQNKQVVQWQQDDYRDMNSKLLDFKNLLSNLRLQSSYTARKASSSNDALVTATATTAANQGSYTLDVTNVAKSANLTSADVVPPAVNAGVGASSVTLAALGVPTNSEITIGGDKGTAKITVNTNSSDTISSFVDSVNDKSGVTGVRVTYEASVDKFFFSSTTTGDNAKVNLTSSTPGALGKLGISSVSSSTLPSPVTGASFDAAGAIVFSSGNKVIDSSLATPQELRITEGSNTYAFVINSTTTIGGLIDQINSSALGKTGFSASLNASGNLSFFNPDDTKSYSFVDPAIDSVDVLGLVGLDTVSIPVTGIDYETSYNKGQNANIVYNGTPISYATNNFQLNGINFTVKGQTTTPVTVNVTQDTDAIFNSIKGFVDKYNELIEKVNTKIGESVYRDFKPLTDEQREAMDEDQIKKWEEKARSGNLRNDSLLSTTLNKFRSILGSPVAGLPTGEANTLAQIGIKSGSYYEKGKLYIDETQLRKSISENPDQVMNLFTASDNSSASTSKDGFALQLYDAANLAITKITEKAGTTSSLLNKYTLGKSIMDMDTRINNLGALLNEKEDRYYSRFTAMESALSKLNAQKDYLAKSLAGG